MLHQQKDRVTDMASSRKAPHPGWREGSCGMTAEIMPTVCTIHSTVSKSLATSFRVHQQLQPGRSTTLQGTTSCSATIAPSKGAILGRFLKNSHARLQLLFAVNMSSLHSPPRHCLDSTRPATHDTIGLSYVQGRGSTCTLCTSCASCEQKGLTSSCHIVCVPCNQHIGSSTVSSRQSRRLRHKVPAVRLSNDHRSSKRVAVGSSSVLQSCNLVE